MLGMELRHYATANDYLIYGVEEDWLRKQHNLLAVWEKQMYQMMHAQGYLVYQAHPFRPGIRRCNPDYIDGIEIYNGKTDVLKNLARGGIITNHKIKNNSDLLQTLQSQDFKMIQNY